ncbi:GerAB/ArcD/ProY family transporter [Pseudogracilibacillus sp. SO30301A]|uniref:GerAB/ArcD/ProY family transporter n=1 Tax=Pseudogracilibacillus sp. SO30301A TaxID=3098291 RepID=UPI00300DD523
MNPFKYSDVQLSESEYVIALPSALIGVAVLSLPREVAKVTSFSDGWVSILLAGIIFTFIAIMGVKLAALFPEKSFLSYTSFLVSRPVAIGIAFINILIALFIVAFSTRALASISQQYLFEHTPMEVLALSFLLVVIYAVSGSRVGIFRLNVLFLPIILFAFLFVLLFNIKWFNAANVFPMFQSDLTDYLNGITKTFEAYVGFGIVLFYFVFIKNPANVTKKVTIGMSVTIAFYMIIFLGCISVFGNAVTGNMHYPTIELAKRVDIPGAILERIDAVVFTIWIMAIFNSTAISLDLGVLLLSSIFKKMKKRILTFILSPIVYFLALFPQQFDQARKIASLLSQFNIYFTCTMILGLFLIAKIRGVKSRDKI